MKYKAIFLDMDGTLIDSISLIMKSDKAAINAFGFEVSNQRLRTLSMLHSRDIAYYLMDTNKKNFDLFDFINFRRRVFVGLLKKHLPKNLWFSDSKEILDKISKKYKVAIITGSRKMFVSEVLTKKELKNINLIVTSDDVEHKKPDIEPVLVALKKLKLKNKEVLFIGDSTQDGLMCQRAGVDFLAKKTGISTEKELKKYDPLFVASSFKEIEKFLGLK